MSNTKMTIKKTLLLLMGGFILVALSGCVIAPHSAGRAVYVEPYYSSPGIRWVWEFHPSFGWGWHQPQRGWHRPGKRR